VSQSSLPGCFLLSCSRCWSDRCCYHWGRRPPHWMVGFTVHDTHGVFHGLKHSVIAFVVETGMKKSENFLSTLDWKFLRNSLAVHAPVTKTSVKKFARYSGSVNWWWRNNDFVSIRALSFLFILTVFDLDRRLFNIVVFLITIRYLLDNY
jgi:hypothetical protein